MTSFDLITNFFERCVQEDIKLLADDVKFICQKLTKLQPYRQKLVLERYLEEWICGMDDADNSSQRQNMGRRKANLYLLNLDTQIH